ncbi:hypothetical protein AKJ65_03225 [candidate division MSBL1 archaeon SCGC-AAA259E19]|uniref:Cohesin domain-containing protein n=1 Tax=candidate division MSBL1 archaeon SCGC-AAA259E19 TaxID=1698264 RepID=A0A133UKU3_9EURY|nr:hypothetical protein AKJ65_03225 [candidate division MSBL1 archaeon SCGC-AAA259E19]
MKSETVFVVLVFILLLATALVSWAEGGSGEVLISSADTVENENVRIELRLSSAPEGLSGFDILVGSENASIVEILSASPPNWAGLSENEIRNDTVLIRAVDLEKKVEPGSENIGLGSLLLKGTSRGTAKITAEVVHMDDDEGNPIRAEVKPGSIRVSSQEKATEQTGPEGGVPLPLIAGIIVIIVAVSAFVAYRKGISK